MENSILKSIRKRIGPDANYDVFDEDLIANINSSFAQLCRQGVGPKKPFYIESEDETWDDFMFNMPLDVKQYIYLKAKIIFDPPQSGTVLKVMQEEVEKLEWLLRETAVTGY